MFDNRYYEEYKGEGAIKVWRNENGIEKGFIIWSGFFNTILEGCFCPDYNKNGILECYYNQDGFYDDKWEMKYPDIVVEELKNFNENNIDIRDEEIIKKSKEVIEELLSFIYTAAENNEAIYVEYE